jgi:hypothetical protein
MVPVSQKVEWEGSYDIEYEDGDEVRNLMHKWIFRAR